MSGVVDSVLVAVKELKHVTTVGTQQGKLVGRKNAVMLRSRR